MRRFAVTALLLVFIALRATAAHAACASPAGNAADIFYNSTAKLFEYCNDTDWVRMNYLAGSGSGGCSIVPSGSRPEGTLIFNADHRQLQGCAGNVWKAITPPDGSANSQWTQVSAGSDHACGIKVDGTAWCWGDGLSGQLGDGSTTAIQTTPVAVNTAGVSGSTWATIGAGSGQSCGIRDDGTAWCWGDRGAGELGDGGATSGSQTTPVAVDTTGVSGSAWTALAVGSAFACGVRDDGTAWCWGTGGSGQLGYGAYIGTQNTPVEVSTGSVSGSSWIALDTGQSHACGIRDDGTAWCWGDNGSGKLGDGSLSVGENAPVAVSSGGVSGAAWTAIAAGGTHTCGIRDDGTAWCWGGSNPYYGQRGDGTSTATQAAPVAVSTGGVSGSAWTSLTTGFTHTCGVRNDGSAWCWGQGDSGQRGDGSITTNQITPTAVSSAGATGSTWTSMSAAVAGLYTCGLRSDGTLRCWGRNDGGQLGTNVSIIHATPANIITTGVSGNSWIVTAAGNSFACGVRDNGTAWCWGYGTDGELGNGSTTAAQSSPVAVSAGGVSGTAWTALAAGIYSQTVCGIRDNGTAWCWGVGNLGQLGNGTTTVARTTPAAVSTGGVSGSNWTAISTGSPTTCGIRDNGTAWCWGWGSFGQRGDGSTTSQKTTPQAVSTSGVSGTAWTNIAVGDLYACAIRDDGTAWCWGVGWFGQRGDGTTTPTQTTPVAVSTGGVSGTAWTDINAGSGHTCGLRDDGTAWCWGAGDSGQHGDGSTTNATAPVAVVAGGVSGAVWTTIAAGSATTCGLRDDGTAWCWGNGSYGQRGDGSTTAIQSTPVAVAANGAVYTNISAGSQMVCATTTAGVIQCWGSGLYGALANGETGLVTTSTMTACGDPPGAPGKIYYNADANQLLVCDGVGWVRAGK